MNSPQNGDLFYVKEKREKEIWKFRLFKKIEKQSIEEQNVLYTEEG